MTTAASPSGSSDHHAAVTKPCWVGSTAPAGVAVASSTPASALPTANPMLRTTWLIVRTLAVSECGTPANTSAGIAAEIPPTPYPSTAMAISTAANDPLAVAKTTAAAMAVTDAPTYTDLAVERAMRLGDALPARKPSTENGMSAAPAAAPGSANPYAASAGV